MDAFSTKRRGVTYKVPVIVSFTVSAKGEITNTYIQKSAEWSADMEALRVIENAPQWKPAIQNGNPVRYRAMQQLTFLVQID